MNKKGYILWTFALLLIAAFSFFIVLSLDSFLGISTKGEWQADFLNNNYLEAQKKLLIIDSTAKSIGSQVALELTQNAGYPKDTASPCGKISSTNLWNKGDKWCLPDITTTLPLLAQKELKTNLPQNTFTDISFDGNYFLAKGQQQTKKTSLAEYTYLTSFSVNLGYSFDEYATLTEDARKIVQCRNTQDFQTCLSQNKPDYWRYQKCDTAQNVLPSKREPTIFCVRSPGLGILATGTTLAQHTTVTYNIGLDLSQTTPFTPDQHTVEKTSGTTTLTFPQDTLATAYGIYYTTWPAVDEAWQRTKDPREIFITMPTSYEKTALKSPVENSCPSTKQPNIAYNCGTNIVYLISHSEDIYVAVTSFIEDNESPLSSFKPSISSNP